MTARTVGRRAQRAHRGSSGGAGLGGEAGRYRNSALCEIQHTGSLHTFLFPLHSQRLLLGHHSLLSLHDMHRKATDKFVLRANPSIGTERQQMARAMGRSTGTGGEARLARRGAGSRASWSAAAVGSSPQHQSMPTTAPTPKKAAKARRAPKRSHQSKAQAIHN